MVNLKSATSQSRAACDNGLVKWLLPLWTLTVLGAQERVVESIVPALAYGPACHSVVELRNLGERPAVVDVEGHKPDGSLAALVGRSGMAVRLAPGEHGAYRLDISQQTDDAWVKIRERVRDARPAVAISASTECLVADQVRTVRREVAFPTRNPWYSSESAESRGSLLSLINTSEHAAKAAVCYSSGGLYSMPSGANPPPGLQPICSIAFEVQVPPFGSREFPTEREGSSHFALKTSGDAIVLQMLRPVEADVHVYSVDSSIRFGGEVKGR